MTMTLIPLLDCGNTNWQIHNRRIFTSDTTFPGPWRWLLNQLNRAWYSYGPTTRKRRLFSLVILTQTRKKLNQFSKIIIYTTIEAAKTARRSSMNHDHWALVLTRWPEFHWSLKNSKKSHKPGPMQFWVPNSPDWCACRSSWYWNLQMFLIIYKSAVESSWSLHMHGRSKKTNLPVCHNS